MTGPIKFIKLARFFKILGVFAKFVYTSFAKIRLLKFVTFTGTNFGTIIF
jgi:hypothetical protein